MIEIGKVLQGRYRIEKQIGQGGMGAVYVATDERFANQVAIKETLCMDENSRKAIEREARLLNSLKHVALPRVTDHFLENEGQFLVMEYIPGEDLNCMLSRAAKPFAVEWVSRWAAQLLDALEYLHHQETPVIHRDIKPQNLKVTPEGQVILLDFGLAKGNPTNGDQNTTAKSLYGYSRSYASIEQIQGTGTDPRSDLYSLAATLYHLLTGTPPTDALTRAMSMLSESADPLVPANAIRPEIARGFAGVLQKAMDMNPSRRPASATEMRQMFRESENYAYLTDGSTAVIPAAPASVLTPLNLSSPGAQTDILRPSASAAFVNQSNFQTDVLTDNLSQMTVPRYLRPELNTQAIPASNTTMAAAPKRSMRGIALAVAAVCLLFAGSLVAGGVYLARPWIFGKAAEAKKDGDAGERKPAAGDVGSTGNRENSDASQTGASSGSVDPENAPVTGDNRVRAPDVAEKPEQPIRTSNPADTVLPRDTRADRVPNETPPRDLVVTQRTPKVPNPGDSRNNGKTSENQPASPGKKPPVQVGIEFDKMVPANKKGKFGSILRGLRVDVPIPTKKP